MPRKSKAKKRSSEAQEESSVQGSNGEEPQMVAYIPAAFMYPPNKIKGRGNTKSSPYHVKQSKTVTVVWTLSEKQEKMLCTADSKPIYEFLLKFIFVLPDWCFNDLIIAAGGSVTSKVVITLSLGPNRCIRIANTNEDLNSEDVKHSLYRIGVNSSHGTLGPRTLSPTESLNDLVLDHEEISIVKMDETAWGNSETARDEIMETRVVRLMSQTTETSKKQTPAKSPTQVTKKTAPTSPRKSSTNKKASSPKANLKKPPGEARLKTGEKTKAVTKTNDSNGKKRKAVDTEIVVFEADARKKKARGGKKDPNAPKGPIGAYFLFAKDARAQVAEKNPDATYAELTKMLGAVWQELDADGKKKYEEKAAADRKRHAAEMVVYKAKVAKEAEEGNNTDSSDDESEPMEATEADNEEDDDSVGEDKKMSADIDVVAVKAKRKKKTKKDPNAPKGPIGAYFLFAKDARAEVAEKNPDATYAELTKMLGTTWQGLDADGKKKYEEKAAADRKRHVAEMVVYKAKVAKEAEEGNNDSDDDSSDDESEPMEATEADNEEDDDSVGEDKKMSADKAGKAQRKQKTKKDPNAPKGPINAYLYFAKDNRAKIAEENPDATYAEVTKMLGPAWQELDPKGKKKFEKKAAADRKRYASEKAAYDAEAVKPRSKVRVNKNAAKTRASEYKPAEDLEDNMDFDAESPSATENKKRAKKKAKKARKGRVVTL